MHELKNREELGQLLHNDTKVLVDFYATFCAPCKHIQPTVQELEREFKADIKFVKANTMTPAIANIADEFKVDSVPTFVAFKNRKVVARFVGANKENFRAFVEDFAAL